MSDSILVREKNRYNLERELLQKQSREGFLSIIRDIGFSCTCCAKCCTSGFNGHVFLLDDDVDRLQNGSDVLIPAPFFDVCDNTGVFYVSGYAMRTDSEGRCLLLKDGRCRIYNDRPLICRVYPYMLHREADERGKVEFRQFSGLDLHGNYHLPLTETEIHEIADITFSYEESWLRHMTEFYTALIRLFEHDGKKSIRKVYDRQIARLRKGDTCTVQVWHRGSFHVHEVSRDDYTGFGWI